MTRRRIVTGDEQDEWCREESCRHRHWRSGSMPTHKRGADCPAPVMPLADDLREQVVEAMSWAEDLETGRFGRDRADDLLRRYEAALVHRVPPTHEKEQA